MPDMTAPNSFTAKRNPLFWIGLVVIGLILFIIFGVDRGSVATSDPAGAANSVGEIDRNLLVPPGMRARQLIEQTRAEGLPYPLSSMYQKAQAYSEEGSLADAHLLYFFTAREGFEPAMMKMGEISDPTLFQSENSLLDRADAIQSYKWYRKLVDLGQADLGRVTAEERIKNLHQWAIQASENGDPDARQLLLTIQ